MVVRVFWSFYFLLGIAVIGLTMGYVVTLSVFLIAWLLSPWKKLSEKVNHLAEYIQCYSIRTLLLLQPWLKCEDNFQSIYGFYDRYQSRKVMFVANHRSNMDTFLLISLIPGLRGMAKSSLYYNIFLAPFMWFVGFVPVEKGNANGFLKGLRLVEEKILKRNRSALVFPETTRCKKNQIGINKFSTAVFEAARRSDALVVPIQIKNTDKLLGRGDIFVYPFQLIKLHIFPELKANDFKSAQDLADKVRSVLMNESLCS